jgi:hypothetical protein
MVYHTICKFTSEGNQFIPDSNQTFPPWFQLIIQLFHITVVPEIKRLIVIHRLDVLPCHI